MTLDLTALDNMFEMIGGDATIMEELVQSFLDETPKLLSQMGAALETRNVGQLARAAHTLKSTGRDFGASEVARLAQAVEMTCKQGFPEDAGDAVSAIASALDLAHSDLKKYGETGFGGRMRNNANG